MSERGQQRARKKAEYLRFFRLYEESIYICLNLFMPCYSTEMLSFTTDIKVSLLIAVNKVQLIPLPSHPAFSTNAIVTAQISCSWATPARKKQFLLLLLLSSHHLD